MHVEINEANIDKFNLVELSGETREFLLSQAADAAAADPPHVLSCNVPDDLVLEQNVFDVYQGEHVDPARLKGCGYEKREVDGGDDIWVCIVHGKSSRYDVAADSHVPCLQVDPEVKPDAEEFKEALKGMSKTCVYNKIDNPRDGTTYICAVHGKTSKYDVTRLPNMPCQAIDPMTPAEGDPHRP